MRIPLRIPISTRENTIIRHHNPTGVRPFDIFRLLNVKFIWTSCFSEIILFTWTSFQPLPGQPLLCMRVYAFPSPPGHFTPLVVALYAFDAGYTWFPVTANQPTRKLDKLKWCSGSLISGASNGDEIKPPEILKRILKK